MLNGVTECSIVVAFTKQKERGNYYDEIVVSESS